MPEQITVSPKSICIRVELHRNGVTLESYVPGKKDSMGEEISYVYKTIEEAAAELPAVASVIKEMMGLNSKNPTKHEPDLGNKKEDKND